MNFIEPVVDKGRYKDFKRCALRCLNLPVIGRVYRLLMDDFACAWKLIGVSEHDGVMFCRFFRPMLTRSKSECTVSREVAFAAQTPTAMSFTNKDTWSSNVESGAVVLDGHDLPQGRIRQWAVTKGIHYVLKFDWDRAMEQLTQETKRASQLIGPYGYEDKSYPAAHQSAKSKFLRYVSSAQKRMGRQTNYQRGSQSPRR